MGGRGTVSLVPFTMFLTSCGIPQRNEGRFSEQLAPGVDNETNRSRSVIITFRDHLCLAADGSANDAHVSAPRVPFSCSRWIGLLLKCLVVDRDTTNPDIALGYEPERSLITIREPMGPVMQSARTRLCPSEETYGRPMCPHNHTHPCLLCGGDSELTLFCIKNPSSGYEKGD